MNPKTTITNDLLAQANQRATERAGEKFRQEQLARFKAEQLKKEAEKKATEENDKK